MTAGSERFNTVPQSLREAALAWLSPLDARAVLAVTCTIALTASHTHQQLGHYLSVPVNCNIELHRT